MQSQTNQRGYIPLKLKAVLCQHGISQLEWAKTIRQADGKPLSGALAARIINWNHWPARTPHEVIHEQTVYFLRTQGVPDPAMKDLWEMEDESAFRWKRRKRATDKKEPRGNGARSADEAQFDKPLPETEMLAQSARKHFALFRDPFQDDVQSADDVFLSADQRYIREAMFTTAKYGGFLAVIGESGAGKSVLRRDLIDRIRREGLPISCIMPRTIDKGRLTAGAICDAIIADISQEHPRRSLEGKARQIEQLLTGSSRAGHSHVLLIEEAHDLTVNTLKYLKRFWELEDGFRKLLSIILIGQPELKAKLDERQNWEAREVIRRCEIAEVSPLNGDLEDYLSLKFKRMSKRLEDIFEPDAFDAMRQRLTLQSRSVKQPISMLYPLVVNNLVVKTMNLAAELGATRINAELVKGV